MKESEDPATAFVKRQRQYADNGLYGPKWMPYFGAVIFVIFAISMLTLILNALLRH